MGITNFNENIFFAVLKSHGLPLPVKEFRFDKIRRWRIDYAYPQQLIAIELEGAVYTRGRHVRPIGFIKDMEKYNALTLQGWRLLRYIPTNINYQQIHDLFFFSSN